jgi:hypothetical protein
VDPPLETCLRIHRLTVLVLGCLASAPGWVYGGQATPALVDQNLSVGAGATLANAVGEAAASIEGKFVPVRLFEERGATRRTANIAYRTARLLLFDRPQEQWLLVANHEVFGHGGRVRELFSGFVGYHLDAPKPYGNGGGVTFYELNRDFTVHEVSAIAVGGIEANSVAAEQIARRAFERRRISPRTALRYLGFELDGFEYVLKTGDEPEPPGHDVSDFIEIYNVVAEAAEAEPLQPRTLRRWTLINLANPMLASAVVGLGRYLLTGQPDSPVFAVPIGSFRVMPVPRYRLTPFGTEVAVTSDIAWLRQSGEAGHTGQIGVRVGRAPLTTPWGIALGYSGLPVGNWRIDVALEGWRQPPLALGAQSDFGLDVAASGSLWWGGQVRARAESALVGTWWSPLPITLIVDASLKSNGFAPGQPLGEGLVLRAGLGLPFGPQ